MNEQDAYKKSSFGPAFFFLGKSRRRALANYYAFCRIADDIADEPQPNAPQALKDLAKEVEFIYLGAPKTNWGKELVEAVRRFHIPKDRFTLLLEGMQADLEQKRYPTLEDLQWYLYRVAVIVGKATLDILGVHGEKADALANALGTAVQLTNIVRDVQEDAKLGRVYLPCELTAAEILENKNPVLVKQLQGQLVQKAKEQYALAFELMDEFWPTKMIPCRIMGYIYQKNLAKIEEGNFVSGAPVKLTKFEKIQMVGYAFIKTFF
ncbi:MAG: squalene/phytoene synthase family protein [Elusimicrobiaceae bacterium]|nr:squalene/phytoene synthase family protein [Elusimicrobiaceae bacterium]